MMLLLMALHIGAVSSAAAADFDKGVAAYEAGDYQTALTEWRPLAEVGDAKAQNNLAVMYDNGEGVPQDHAEAARWFRHATEQGLAKAQFNLALLYDNGEGVPQDYLMAHMWYNLSASHGNELGVKNRKRLALQMSSDALLKAQALARQCLASDYQDCGE